MQCGSHLIASWSRTQQNIALSSGEAEFYALCTGCCEGLFTVSLMCEILPERLRPEKVFRLYSDATAGRGICQRQGPGKVRHLSIRNLWIQDLVEKRIVQISKIQGTENVADLLTKAVSLSVLEYLR